MNRLFRSIQLLLALAWGAGASAAAAIEQSLHFRNGDSLKGQLVEMTSTDGVLWRRPELQQPIRFFSTNIAEIFLGARPAFDATNGPARTLIRFANGDELIGSLVSITNDAILLDTSYAGRLKLPRNLVASLLPRGMNDSVIYDGIRDGSTWTHGDMSAVQGVPVGRWQFHNASLFSGAASSVARNMNLPFEIRIDFDLYWSDLFSLAIGLHTDSLEPISLNARELEPDFAPFYSLWISPTATQLRVVPKTGPIRQLGSVFMRLPPGANHVPFTIFTSKKRNSVTIMAAGRVVHDWIDPAGWSAGGRGIRFVHQGYGNVRIANLRITRWDGQGMPAATLPPNPEVDVVLLNGTSALGGQLTGFTNGVFHFSSGGQTRSLPFDQVTHAGFATKQWAAASGETGAIMVAFNGVGRLTGDLRSWNAKVAHLAVPGIGDIRVQSQALGRIRFPKPTPPAASK